MVDPLSRLPYKQCTHCGNQDDDVNIVCLITDMETANGDVEDNFNMTSDDSDI